MTHQRNGPTNHEPLPQRPHKHSEVEQPANPPHRVDRNALRSSHHQPVQADPQHHDLNPSPAAKAPQQHADYGGLPPKDRLITEAEAATRLRGTERPIEGRGARRPLSPAATELLHEREGTLPVWIRSPRRGHEHYTGLSRAKLYKLAGLGVIQSRSLREPGHVRGVRLFNLRSILDYIDRS